LDIKATAANATRVGTKHESENGSRPRLVKIIVASEHEKVLLLLCNCTELCDQSNPDEVRKYMI